MVSSKWKANKESCRCLAVRVNDLKELVGSIKQRNLSSPNVRRALHKLSVTLGDAHELVEKCTSKNVLNFLKLKSKIDTVNECLSNNFQVLSGALLIEQGNMMHRMAEDCDVTEDERDNRSGLFGATGRVRSSLAVATLPFSAAAARVPFSTAPAIRYTTSAAPVSFSNATAVMPFYAPVAPAPFFPNVAATLPFSATTASVYVSTMGVENGNLIHREAFFRQRDLGRFSTTTQFNNKLL